MDLRPRSRQADRSTSSKSQCASVFILLYELVGEKIHLVLTEDAEGGPLSSIMRCDNRTTTLVLSNLTRHYWQ